MYFYLKGLYKRGICHINREITCFSNVLNNVIYKIECVFAHIPYEFTYSLGITGSKVVSIVEYQQVTKTLMAL